MAKQNRYAQYLFLGSIIRFNILLYMKCNVCESQIKWFSKHVLVTRKLCTRPDGGRWNGAQQTHEGEDNLWEGTATILYWGGQSRYVSDDECNKVKVNLLKHMWVVVLQSSKNSKLIKNTHYIKYWMCGGNWYIWQGQTFISVFYSLYNCLLYILKWNTRTELLSLNVHKSKFLNYLNTQNGYDTSSYKVLGKYL